MRADAPALPRSRAVGRRGAGGPRAPRRVRPLLAALRLRGEAAHVRPASGGGPDAAGFEATPVRSEDRALARQVVRAIDVAGWAEVVARDEQRRKRPRALV